MIVLDTNVVSALMGAVTDPLVIRWLDRQPRESVWTTSITVFELKFGLSLLPEGKKRRALEHEFQRLIEEDLENRILDFDTASATVAGSLAARRKLNGTSADVRDTQIAGIVVSHHATLATRNIRHFADIDASVVDPWTA